MMMDITEPDFYSGKIIKPPSELLNEAHNHLQDAGFYAEAGETALCLASIAKVYDLHEQMSKILGDDDETNLPVRHPSAGA
jgi:hypothetical protein